MCFHNSFSAISGFFVLQASRGSRWPVPAGCIPRKYEVKTSVAIAVDVQRLQKCQHHRTISGSITREMKAPVPLAPGFYFGILLQRLLVLYEDVFRAVKILFLHVRDGAMASCRSRSPSRNSQLRIFSCRRSVTSAERDCRGMGADFCVRDHCHVSSEDVAIRCVRLRLLWCFPAAEALSRKLRPIEPAIPGDSMFGHVQSPWIVPVLIPGLPSWTHDVPW